LGNAWRMKRIICRGFPKTAQIFEVIIHFIPMSGNRQKQSHNRYKNLPRLMIIFLKGLL